jgi:hypothetical protein
MAADQPPDFALSPEFVKACEDLHAALARDVARFVEAYHVAVVEPVVRGVTAMVEAANANARKDVTHG